MFDDSGSTDRAVTRRRFLLATSGVVLGGGAVLLAGCAGDTDGGTSVEKSLGETTAEETDTETTTSAQPTKYSCECNEAHEYEWTDVTDVLPSCPQCGETSGITCTQNPNNPSEASFDCHHLCPEESYSWTSTTDTTQCPADPSHTNAKCEASE